MRKSAAAAEKLRVGGTLLNPVVVDVPEIGLWRRLGGIGGSD